MKKASITGVTGQDGAYPAESLLAKSYTTCIEHNYSSSLIRVAQRVQPDEICSFAAQSHVQRIANPKAPDVLRCLEAAGCPGPASKPATSAKSNLRSSWNGVPHSRETTVEF